MKERRRDRQQRKRKRRRKRKRKRGRGRERVGEREREEEEGKGKEKAKRKKKKEKGDPGPALEKNAAIVNPGNKPTKVNWPSHGPVPWKLVDLLFLNRGLTRDWLIWEWQTTMIFLPEKYVIAFLHKLVFFFKKHGLPRVLTTIVNLPNIAWVPNKLEKMHNSEPSYYSGYNIDSDFHQVSMVLRGSRQNPEIGQTMTRTSCCYSYLGSPLNRSQQILIAGQ